MAHLPPRRALTVCNAPVPHGSSTGTISTSQSHTHTNSTVRDELEEKKCLGLRTTKAGLLAWPQSCLGLDLHPTAFNEVNGGKKLKRGLIL